MLFGLREEFEYFLCSNCGCLQIKKVPPDLAKYYPKEYKTFRARSIKQSFYKSLIKKAIGKYSLLRKKPKFVKTILEKFGFGFIDNLSKAGLSQSSKILDVGTGGGQRIISLFKNGFTDLTGTDIFIEKDIIFNKSLRIFKKEISELTGKYDFIMLNHVLEHIPDQQKTLNILYKLLRSGKYLLIRIPVVGGYTWRKYKESWVAWDAPRHFYLHSEKSMRLLAENCGFRIVSIYYDSSDYQFWASEQYKNDIPLYNPKSYHIDPNTSIFTKMEIKDYKIKAKELNKNNDGNAAGFLLYKSN